MRAAFVILAAATMAACVSLPAPSGAALSVNALIDEQDEHFGKRIRIYGYISDCLGYDCALQSSATANTARALGIGISEDFGIYEPQFRKRWVEIEATVIETCFPNKNPKIIALCTDRVNNLDDAKFIGFVKEP